MDFESEKNRKSTLPNLSKASIKERLLNIAPTFAGHGIIELTKSIRIQQVTPCDNRQYYLFKNI